MTLQLLQSEFPYIWRNIWFSFLSVYRTLLTPSMPRKVMRPLSSWRLILKALPAAMISICKCGENTLSLLSKNSLRSTKACTHSAQVRTSSAQGSTDSDHRYDSVGICSFRHYYCTVCRRMLRSNHKKWTASIKNPSPCFILLSRITYLCCCYVTVSYFGKRRRLSTRLVAWNVHGTQKLIKEGHAFLLSLALAPSSLHRQNLYLQHRENVH